MFRTSQTVLLVSLPLPFPSSHILCKADPQLVPFSSTSNPFPALSCPFPLATILFLYNLSLQVTQQMVNTLYLLSFQTHGLILVSQAFVWTQHKFMSKSLFSQFTFFLTSQHHKILLTTLFL